MRGLPQWGHVGGVVKVKKDIPKTSLIKPYFFFHLHPIYFFNL